LEITSFNLNPGESDPLEHNFISSDTFIISRKYIKNIKIVTNKFVGIPICLRCIGLPFLPSLETLYIGDGLEKLENVKP